MQPRFLLSLTTDDQTSTRLNPISSSLLYRSMLSVAIALGTLALVLPISGMLWFWFVRSQD